MDWMPVRTNIWTNRRTLALVDVLAAGNLPGCGTLTLDDVVSKVLRAWSWARDETTNGKLTGATARELDLIVRHDGFALALSHERVGWLEIHEATDAGDQPYLRFPEWDKWNSKGAKARLQAALRQAKKRHVDVPDASRSRHAARGTNRRAEQSREQQRTEEDNAAVLSALPDESVKRNCSLLLKLVDTDVKGSKPFPIFDGKACAAIAADARCSEMRIVWAVEKLRSMRTPPRKKAAWLRAMILEDDKAPSAEWVSKYQRGQLAKLADPARAMASGGGA